MSSSRFPGKVLAPFRGQPVILHILKAIEFALPGIPVVVVTSTQMSDDPLTAYLKDQGKAVFRGPLDDVFGRFRAALAEHPCDWVMRICGDSPLIDGKVLERVAAARTDQLDLVTTTLKRTFPIGQNAELIRTAAMLAVDERELTAHDREHVTPFFHRHPDRYRILNIESDDPSRGALSFAVDTIEDLKRLEAAA